MSLSCESIFKSYIHWFIFCFLKQHSTPTWRKHSDLHYIKAGPSNLWPPPQAVIKHTGRWHLRVLLAVAAKSYDPLFKKKKKKTRRRWGEPKRDWTYTDSSGWVYLFRAALRRVKSSATGHEWTQREACATRQATERVEESLQCGQATPVYKLQHATLQAC